jgi:hypothetical protein
MTKANPSDHSELKTIGFTPFMYLSDQPLFHVCRNVPIADALAQASDLLYLPDRRCRLRPRLRPPRLGRALPDDDEQSGD